MSSSFKCPFFNIHYFSNHSAYSQHVKKYIEKHEISTEESNIEISDTNEMSLDSEDFSQSVQEENSFEINMQESDHDYSGDISFSNIPSEFISNSENFENLPSNFSFEEEILPESLQSFEDEFKDESEDESEEEPIKDFPNKAYADLMELVIKNNLNNKTGNAIIKFFNKYSNLLQLPLPKNIETG